MCSINEMVDMIYVLGEVGGIRCWQPECIHTDFRTGGIQRQKTIEKYRKDLKEQVVSSMKNIFAEDHQLKPKMSIWCYKMLLTLVPGP